MKKRIISVFVAICMLISSMAIFTAATNLNIARTCGYCVWHENNVEVFFANTTVATRAAAASYKGIAVASSNALSWDGGTPLQLSGDISVDGTKGSFALHAGHGCTVADIFEGNKVVSSDKTMTEWASIKGAEITLRLEGNDGEYYCYYLPIYAEDAIPTFNGLHLVKAEFAENGTDLYVTFNGEVDNVWDAENKRDDYMAGQTRFCAIRIVDNTTNWNLQWDGETPAQWSAPINAYYQAWPCKTMVANVSYGGTLGCNSFADICELVEKGGKFEGCVVAYCIEEVGTTEHPATQADGNILSFFANGDYGADMHGALKANRVVANQFDGAYVTMYDPNPIEWIKDAAVDTTLEASLVNVTSDSTGLYVSFSEPVAAPGTDVCLSLVGYGWPAEGNLRYTRRIELTNPTVVADTNNTVWKFSCTSDMKSWFISGDEAAEGHYGTTLPHPIDGNDGARWHVMLFGEVKSADGTKTLAVDTTKTVYDNSVAAGAKNGYVLFAGTEAESGTYAERRVGINLLNVATVADINTVGVTLYNVAGDTDYVYLSFSEPVTLGKDFHLNVYFLHRWSAADPSYVIWHLGVSSDSFEQIDTAGRVYKVTNSAWKDAHTASYAFNPTSSGYFGTQNCKVKAAIVGTVTTNDNGKQVTFYDKDDANDGYGCRFHNDTTGSNFQAGLDITWTYETVDSVENIPGMDEVFSVVISYSDSNATDGTIDSIYINSLATYEGTYGILFAENEYATDALMRLPSDGGNPLFSKECTQYWSILQSDSYGSATFTTFNLLKNASGHEFNIALHWKNLPAYNKLAARAYKVLSNGDVVYGPITEISLVDGGSYLPL